LVSAIITFHGGGQDLDVIARSWRVRGRANPCRHSTTTCLVVPESDPRMTSEWVHLQTGDTGFPTFDLNFVRDLIAEKRLAPQQLKAIGSVQSQLPVR
jgi:hypothetical protein